MVQTCEKVAPRGLFIFQSVSGRTSPMSMVLSDALQLRFYYAARWRRGDAKPLSFAASCVMKRSIGPILDHIGGGGKESLGDTMMQQCSAPIITFYLSKYQARPDVMLLNSMFLHFAFACKWFVTNFTLMASFMNCCNMNLDILLA